MSHNRDYIPSSSSSKATATATATATSSSSSIARLMSFAPANKTTSTAIKPFLLGFTVAIVLIGIAAILSIRVICGNYDPIDYHSSRIINDDRVTTMKSSSKYHSSQTIVTEHEMENSSRLEKDDRHLKWREAMPFISFYIPNQKKKMRPDEGEVDPSGNINEEICSPSQPDTRSCLCYFVWESLGNYNMKSENYFTEGATREKSLQERKDPFLQQAQATERFPTAFTPEIFDLSSQQENLVKNLGYKVLKSISDFEQRSSLVPWGGPQPAGKEASFDWYASKKAQQGLSAPLDGIVGGNLFASYLRIMNWPENLGKTDFPFKLCKTKKRIEGKGCDTTDSIQHTLEFRERYKPWLVTDAIKRANANGFVYIRGFSPPYSENEHGGHAIVWIRLARKLKTDDEHDRIYFVRSLIREFDRAVAISLRHSNGRVGKFNAIVDGEGFTWSSMPSLSAVKNLVTILQDHFADRLGVIILVNIGTVCQFLLKLFLPLITEEVRNKIVVIPNDEKERLDDLEAILGRKENIPLGLGGSDDYDFRSDEYYANEVFGRDEEALEYLTTMPFHA